MCAVCLFTFCIPQVAEQVLVSITRLDGLSQLQQMLLSLESLPQCAIHLLLVTSNLSLGCLPHASSNLLDLTKVLLLVTCNFSPTCFLYVACQIWQKFQNDDSWGARLSSSGEEGRSHLTLRSVRWLSKLGRVLILSNSSTIYCSEPSGFCVLEAFDWLIDWSGEGLQSCQYSSGCQKGGVLLLLSQMSSKSSSLFIGPR